MTAWFAVEEVAPRTWLVAEPGHVNSFLVEGDDRAVETTPSPTSPPTRPPRHH
jgi:hypothetical protein